ncbi:MAG: hypothetical protein HC929_09575 [Leptolyngbyaceae cyanobacterium SM2_5_2]|nr:hypothetical protein [Leptolyngbyaceae cyanobacterium SM2_5_2]
MEAIIVVAIVLIFWTNEALFGKPVSQPKKPETKEDKLAKALADYLNDGVKTK